jgi:DNA-binding protein HU-beta
MQKKAFIEKLSEKLSFTKAQAERSWDAIFELLSEVLAQKEEISVPGFGRFGVKQKAGRKGRNPSTGKEIDIPAKTVPVFKPATQLRLKVNG